jgi:hypothetical protein
MIGLAALLSTRLGHSTTPSKEVISLSSGFSNPPFSAKPHTWWHWINGNISKEGITADLEAMKRFGLGGAQIFNVDVGIPVGDKPFMTPQWKDAIGWAFKEGRRLGLEIDIHNGAGWSSSGGPWVTPANSMQFLAWTETKVHGPIHFTGTLPEPKKTFDYYEDIACYAVRNPANDSFRIANIREKAAFDRGDRIAPDSSAIPADAAIPPGDIQQVSMKPDGTVSCDLGPGDWTIIRLGHTPTGAQNEPSPKAGLGPEVDKLSRSALDQFWSGMMATAVKENGPIGKTGLIGALIDSYEVGSQNWTPKFREEFMKRRGYDPMPFILAVTGRVIGSGEATERFLWDVRRTVCDLFSDNYYGYMTELCHKNGLQFSTEGYGNGSFDNLQVNGDVDIPMAEFWVGGAATETTKMVSSSAHIHGKNIVGAESFTADTEHAKWLYDPYSIKALGDKMFSLGINRYIFHRYTLQPWLNLEPGMTMGPWGSNFERTNTWWDQGRAWIKYITRCQYMLQQGRFDADVLAFEGDDGPNDLPLMRGSTFPAGYDYDGCDTQTLLKAKVENGQIVLPSGMRYRVLMLPDTPWMTLKTTQKLDELVRAGAVVVGPKPLKSPTYGDSGQGDATVAKIGNKLWGGDDGAGKVFPPTPIAQVLATVGVPKDVDSTRPVNWIHRTVDGQEVYFVANPSYHPVDVDVTFRVAGKQPEIWNSETGDMEKAAVWRSNMNSTTVPLRLESAQSVFVVFRNSSSDNHFMSIKWLGEGEQVPAAPKVEIVQARYEAVDGSGGADVTEKVKEMVANGGSTVEANNTNFGDTALDHVKRLHLVYTVDGVQKVQDVSENESLDLVSPTSAIMPPLYTVHDGSVEFWSKGKVELRNLAGTKTLEGAPSEIPIGGPWSLSFPPGKGAPATATFDKLISWPDSSVDGIKYFSGTASYRTSFDAGKLNAKNASYWLDLGEVKNFAEVRLNGHALPTLWKAPFRIDVSPYLKSGSNDLEIKVTNLWPNRLIGDEHYPPDAKYNGPIQSWPDWLKGPNPKLPGQRVTFATWEFFGKNDPLLPSGLIGPAKIVRVPTLRISP